MFKILLVGFGSIGFRYFQAINRINLSIKLFIFDKNKQVKEKILDKNNKIFLLVISINYQKMLIWLFYQLLQMVELIYLIN